MSEEAVHPVQPILAVRDLLERGDLAAAADACAALESKHPDDVQLRLWASNVHQRLGHFGAMIESAWAAQRLRPRDPALQRRLVECWVYSGRIDAARERLAQFERDAAGGVDALLRIAELHLHCEGHADARRCYERAATSAPDDARVLHGLASTALSLGRLDDAEVAYARILARNPADGDAWLNRASLRTWSADDHHLAELFRALAAVPDGHSSQIPLHYAIGKEFEDIQDSDRAFHHYARGAALRRAVLGYRVDSDVDTMARIAEAFSRDVLSRTAVPVAVEPSIFVLGLPRSGTTLVDRILGSHPDVASLGEVNTFVFALMRLAAGSGDKHDLVRRSTRVDFARLGSLYRGGIASYGLGAPRLSNKTPSNFLYLGLIHLALPGASVVHLRRHPLDSCLAMFKTLFRMGYPFSYSLEDLGRYYVAYHRLMAHWRAALPSAFIDLDYETVVSDQEGATRRLLAHCGLDFDSRCLSFHLNDKPTATASAAQVRRPLYASSSGRWRRYAKHLEPLANMLEANGISCA